MSRLHPLTRVTRRRVSAGVVTLALGGALVLPVTLTPADAADWRALDVPQSQVSAPSADVREPDATMDGAGNATAVWQQGGQGAYTIMAATRLAPAAAGRRRAGSSS